MVQSVPCERLAGGRVIGKMIGTAIGPASFVGSELRAQPSKIVLV
jgi:hypothetical protein